MTARGNVPLEESIVTSLFIGRHDTKVYGLGAFFAPNAFDPGMRYVSFYVHGGQRVSNPYDRYVNGVDQIFYGVQQFAKPSDNYMRYAWWRDAVAVPSEVEFEGPYMEDGRSFISVLRAFSDGKRVVGVMTVDTLTPTFQDLLRASLIGGDVTWVAIPAGGTWTQLVATAPVPAGGDRRMEHIPLKYSTASLFISSDASSVTATTLQSWSTAAVLLIGIWGAAIVIAVILMQRWRDESARMALEEELRVRGAVEHELRKKAYTDELTGLGNRAAAIDLLQKVLDGEPRGRYALIFIDLDRFNVVNETLGHLVGDELLRIVAARLNALPDVLHVAHPGGDEFIVVAQMAGSSHALADRYLVSIGEPALLRGQTVYPRASAGIVLIDDRYERAEELLRDADIAVYAAKHAGRERAALFDDEMRRRVAIESELDRDLRRALDRGDIVPYYQPIVDLQTRRIIGFEALARWIQASGEITGGFVPFAEERGFAQRIDLAILRSVSSQIGSIVAMFPGTTISANISTIELGTAGFDLVLRDLLAEYDVRPEHLKLEITETATMTGGPQARETLDALRNLGITLVLDDFGTGYSSLSYLQRLPISAIKIDRSFVEHLPHDVGSIEIVRSVVALAKSFGLPTTAEGIENAAQCDLLVELGVSSGQGYFFSPAVAVSSLATLQTPDGYGIASNSPS